MTLPSLMFVAGAGRSGSTLLEGLVAERTGAVAVGELSYVWERGFRLDERCSCGEPFHACPLWRPAVDLAFGGPGPERVADLVESQRHLYRMRHIPQLRVRALRSAETRRHLARLVAGYRRLYEAVAEVSGATLVVDSSKQAVHGYVLAELTGRDLAVVQLVRDSRAVAYAWQKRVPRPEATTENQFMATFDARASSTIWLQDNYFCGGLRRHVRRSALLRYEDLVGDAGAVDAMLRTLRISGTPVEGQVRHSVSGNPSRMGGEPTPLRLDRAWADRLSAHDRRLVTAMTGPGLVRYGYDLRVRP